MPWPRRRKDLPLFVSGGMRRASLRPGQAWPFDHPFYLLLNLAVGGYWPGPPDATTHFPAKMLVDWVRVYKRG